MEREVVKNNNNHQHHRGEVAFGTAYETTTTTETTTTPATDFVLQWGNRKRLRCMKIQVKDDSTADAKTTTVRVDRRVVKAEKEFSSSNTITTTTTTNNFNLRRPTSSPPPPPPPPPTHRILRNSETSGLMKGQTNGVRSSTSFSPERGGEERAHDKKSNNTTTTNNNNNNNNHHHHHHHNNNNNGGGGPSMSSETAQDSKKGGSSSGSEVIPVWPPKFVIALTNKEKEEDFMAIKGSKLPLRPKKRAKIIQRTLNLVSPGSWLCDLTIERYEVREKKITKKRPRGLKAMGNIDSDSE